MLGRPIEWRMRTTGRYLSDVLRCGPLPGWGLADLVSICDNDNLVLLSLLALFPGGADMPDLLVRGVDEALVRALKERAGAHGRSAEAEHREILAEALARPRKRALAQLLASIPDVGTDADFERVEPDRKAPRVFD